MRSIILITALLLAQSGRAELLNAQQLQQLNQKIEKTGGDWHAERNHMTVLSKEEVRYRLGLHREGAVEAQFASNNTRMLADLPAQLDWRNKDGKNWVSPILDQANCGSCVAFASIGVLETQYKISSLIPDFNARFSAQNLFSCGGGYCNWGWQPDSAAEFLQRTGVPDEACMPYSSGATGKDVSCRVSCPDTSTRSVKITSYTQPTSGSQDLQAVKQALQKGPLVTTLSVYADFMAYAGGVYKHTSGEMMGGHAVSIVGYDDTMSAFIVRNSWGEEWGDKGFVYVSYDDESGIGDETWLYNMPSMAGGVSIETPNDYSYYTGTAAVKAVSSYQATDSMTLAVFNGQNQAVANVSCAGASCNQNMDVSGLADGRYEVQAFAMNNHGEKIGTSERHFFYVVNQAPQLNVSFTGVPGTDLRKDLKGRIEMAITTSSSSVPLSSIVFHRRGPDGKDETRTASVVPAALTMGWRTNLVSNGAYELWYVGHLKSNGLDLTVESAHQTVNVKN